MKEKLIKYRLPIIIVAVVIVFITVAAVVGLVRGKETAEAESRQARYFMESYYPVETEINRDGTMTISLDGSQTPDLKWVAENESKDMVEVMDEATDENGIYRAKLSPIAMGYPQIVFKKEGEINGYKYTAGEVLVQLLVTEDSEGKLSTEMSDIYQYQTYLGAMDTENPFLIKEGRVLLLNGGDWQLSVSEVTGNLTEDSIEIYTGEDEGLSYLGVYTEDIVELSNGSTAKVQLSSESLGILQSFDVTIDENGDYFLKLEDQGEEDEEG